MKAVVYNAPFDVSVKEVEDARIEAPNDAIVRITTANICGSDLHPYEGRVEFEPGSVFGHENMGIVEEVGPGVNRIQVGDRVSVPFNLACGTCRNCTEGFTSACLRANPSGQPGAGYGYPMMGPYRGGQAEYLRVPWADFNLLELPKGDEHELDFTMLSDIFPTGYHGTELAQVSPGNTVAIWGAGPVGLMAAHSAAIRGASQVFVVDFHPDRLRLAERFGATPIDVTQVDAVQAIIDATDGFGVDCGVEAVGYQAHDATGEEHPGMALDGLIGAVRATGKIGVVGVYEPEDPGASTEQAKKGHYAFDFGTAFTKGIAIGTGQCPVKKYNRQLRDLIIRDVATPRMIKSRSSRLYFFTGHWPVPIERPFVKAVPKSKA